MKKNETKTQDTLTTAQNALSNLSAEQKIALFANSIGEIARDKAVEAVTNAVSQIISTTVATSTATIGLKSTTANTAPSTTNTQATTKRRGRKAGSKNKPKANANNTAAPATPKKKSIPDFVIEVLAANGNDMPVKAVVEALQKTEGFSTKSANVDAMVRTYLNDLAKAGKILNTGFGVYKAIASNEPENTQAPAPEATQAAETPEPIEITANEPAGEPVGSAA